MSGEEFENYQRVQEAIKSKRMSFQTPQKTSTSESDSSMTQPSSGNKLIDLTSESIKAYKTPDTI